MNDIEIIRLTAEAMGYEFDKTIGFYSDEQIRFIGKRGVSNEIVWDKKYDPLHDDAQAMALVKKMRLHPMLQDRDDGIAIWDVFGDGWHYGSSPDLNHAICECVANMMRVK